MGQTNLVVSIDEDLRRQAEATAAATGTSLAEVVSAALEQFVEEAKPPEAFDPEEALRSDPLLSLRFSGGPGDVAGRYKQILMDAIDPIEGLSAADDPR